MPHSNQSADGARFSLSAKSTAIMALIAQGCSYEQIVAAHPSITYRDIFKAAEEVLAATKLPDSNPRRGAPDAPAHANEDDYRTRVKLRHRRAYEVWTAREEDQLRRLIEDGLTVARIAGRLERNRGAIRARIVRLGLVNRHEPSEQERLRWAMEQQGLGDV